MTCRVCLAENPADARFCKNCGAPLGAPIATAGERKVVTILFADVVGFTPLAEREPAPAVVTMLNELFTILTEIVFRHEGTLEKYIGDALMAIWGVPTPHEDDADRAAATFRGQFG